MEFSKIFTYRFVPFTAMSAGTGLLLGMDFSDPQTVNTLLGGGLAFVALIILWRITTRAFTHSSEGEKNESELLGLLRIMLVDLQRSIDTSRTALENNNQLMLSLKEVIETEYKSTSETIEHLTESINDLSAEVRSVQGKVEGFENALKELRKN